MPNFQKHLLSGIILGSILVLLFKDLVYLLVAMVFATLPDLDIGTSIPARVYAISASVYAIYMLIIPQTFYKIIFGYDVPQRYFAIPPLLGLIILQFVNHREWLHSISAGFIFSLPLWFFFNIWTALIGFSAFLLHLALDGELWDGLFT